MLYSERLLQSRLLEQLLSEHDDGLLWDLNALGKALVHQFKTILSFLSHRLVNKLGHILHIDQIAHLVIIQDVKDLNLHDLALLRRVRVWLLHLKRPLLIIMFRAHVTRLFIVFNRRRVWAQPVLRVFCHLHDIKKA